MPVLRGTFAGGAHPDACGGGFAEVNAVGFDFERHGFVVFTAEDAELGPGAEAESVKEFQELGVFFVDGQNFYCAGDGDFAEGHGAAAAEAFKTAGHGHAVRAGARGAEAAREQAFDFGGDAVLEALSFDVGAGPIEADYVGEKFFGELMAESEAPGFGSAARSEHDAAAAFDAQQAVARQAFERGGDGGRRDAQFIGEARADGRAAFLDHFPDGLQIVFAGDAGFFARHDAVVASRFSSGVT